MDGNTSEQEQQLQPADENTSEQEQQLQHVQAIHAYFKDIYDVEQRMADARAHMDAVKPKYNNDQKKYSKDPEYQKYLKIMSNTEIALPKWPNVFNGVPKLRNFAKSGHIVWQTKINRKSS